MANEIRILELFSGIGAQAQSLKEIGLTPYAYISEIDKTAIAAYNAIHGNTENLGDVQEIRTIPEVDIMTYSFPCQDLSVAGCRRGMSYGDNTRSALVWEVGRILKAAKQESDMAALPPTLIMENVSAILHKKNIKNFKMWIEFLSKLGYTSTYAILNAKDFGIPQYRERVFMVSMLNNRSFVFPEYDPKESKLMDYLEKNPESKYYLSEQTIATNRRHAERHKNDGLGWKISDQNGIARCLTTRADRHSSTYIKDERGIRKLTPREFWRLQGQPDRNYDAVSKMGISDARLYALAGNSIAVPVLNYVFKAIIDESWTIQRKLEVY